MDFQKIVNQQLEKYIQEKLPESINKHVECMIDAILQELFARYWETAKQVKSVLSEKVWLDLSKLELVDYNWTIATAIQNHFNHLSQTHSVEPILELVSDVVWKKYEKDSISLDDLFDEVKQIAYDAAEYWEEEEVSFFAQYNARHWWVEVFTDSETGTSKDDCSVRFLISKETKWIFSVSFAHIYKDREISTIDVSRLWLVEKFIHKLWCSWTKITFDPPAFWNEFDFDTAFVKED